MIKNFLVWWTIIVFLCAAIFRLTSLDLIEFKLDEARDVYEMERFWQNPTLLERGTIQSTGVYNPPLWYYILAVISVPSRDPQYLSFVIALINCVAVAGFYLVIRRFFGQWVGLSAALFLAFSPWNILFSRKIWAPDMILPFAVLWLYFLFVILGRSKATTPESDTDAGQASMTLQNTKWAWFGLVLSLSLLAQLHASGIFLSMATVIILIIIHLRGEKMRLHLGGVILGLLLGLIPLLPYINYQIRTGCEDCRNYSVYKQGETVVQPVFDGNAFLRPFQFINASGWDNVLGSDGFRDFKEKYPLVSLFNFVFLLEFLLLPLGIFHLRGEKMRLHLGGVILAIPILYFVSKTPSHLYYFLIISPITILIYTFGAFHPGGVLSNRSASRESAGLPFALRAEPIRGVLTNVIVGVIITINIVFELMFVNFLSETKIIPGDFGATYGIVKEMAREKGMKVEEYVINKYSL